jgi:general secretion pathway protein G
MIGKIDNNISTTRGFTLTELLVVLVILGLLAALVGPNLYNRIKPAKQSVAAAQIEHFATALDSFFVDVGRFPTSTEGLNALQQKPRNSKHWQGPYLKKTLPLDPWENHYRYRMPGQHGAYDIISYGADGKSGGKGENSDIKSWEAR